MNRLRVAVGQKLIKTNARVPTIDIRQEIRVTEINLVGPTSHSIHLRNRTVH